MDIWEGHKQGINRLNTIRKIKLLRQGSMLGGAWEIVFGENCG